jgi:hypothetical protein
MAVETEPGITEVIQQAIQEERQLMFKLICSFCGEGNAPVKDPGGSKFAWWHWAEDRQRRKQCEAARLREWMQLPNFPSRLLAAQISRISERVFAQAWMNNIEFNLWTVLEFLPYPTRLTGRKKYFGLEDINDAELAEIKNLAEQADGWVYWNTYDLAFKFVSFPEWEKVHAAQLDRYRRIPQEFEKIIQTVPQEELDRLPLDASEQHDHYIHGASKRE